MKFNIAGLLVTPFLLLAMSVANAIPLTPPGFLDDQGDSYFTPTDDAAVAIELLDLADPVTEFGFYFRNDPSTLIAIFDNTDIGPGQVSAIDFVGGSVVDLDGDGGTSFFAGSSESIGFYLNVLNALTIYSDPNLNGIIGNIDLFYAFEDETNPLLWALIFEADTGTGELVDVNINIVGPISPVPIPAAFILMGSLLPGLFWMARRRRTATVS